MRKEKEMEKNAAQYKLLENKAKASCFHFGLLLFFTMVWYQSKCHFVVSFLENEIVRLSLLKGFNRVCLSHPNGLNTFNTADQPAMTPTRYRKFR